MTRHHHDRADQIICIRPLAQQRDAIGIRHPDIEQDQIKLSLRPRGPCLARICSYGYAIAFVAENVGNQCPDVVFVIHDKYL